MSQYGIVMQDWWDGETGRDIAGHGGRSAQLVALYLMANPAATMIGLYPLEVVVVQARIRTLKAREITLALTALHEVGFASFDTTTEMVWVTEMAKFRLGLDRKPLERTDKRAEGCRKLYQTARPNPFLGPFFDRYAKDLHLVTRRTYEAPQKGLRSKPAAPQQGPYEGASQGPSEGASKPVNRDQRSLSRETEDLRDQEGQEQRADARDSHAVLVRISHEVLKAHGGVIVATQGGNLVDIVEDIKTTAARAGIPYDGDVVTAALNSAEFQRERRRTAS